MLQKLHMILFKNKTGQLSNNIFEFATFLVVAKHTNSWLVNTCFHDSKSFFVGTNKTIDTKNKLFVGNKFHELLLLKCLELFSSFFNKYIIRGFGTHIMLDDETINQKFLIKDGGWFTHFKYFYENSLYVKQIFKPIPDIQNKLNSLNIEYRANTDLLIGIHLRKGDYRTFLNGIYYFENDIYKDKLGQIRDLFPNRKVKFLLASNEEIVKNDFYEFDIILAPNTAILDLYSLAVCDFLCGPPSTFTMWASFYGNVPLAKIREKDQKITLVDFKVDYGY